MWQELNTREQSSKGDLMGDEHAPVGKARSERETVSRQEGHERVLGSKVASS